jgi:hypothetical protein
LSFRFRGIFWLATAVGQVIFLIGIGVVHAREVLKQKIFLFDILMPLVHIGLLKVYKPLEAQPYRENEVSGSPLSFRGRAWR